QTHRRGHWTWSIDQLRDRYATAWRLYRGRQRDWLVHGVHGAPAAARQWHRVRKQGMTVSILVVDDEPDVAELFRQRFRREARQGTYVMHFASSGEDALSKLNNGVDPQLIVILSDINMPGMDGLTLLGEIKRRWPELRVIMVRAFGDDERRRVAGERGAADFLAKPVDFEFLKQQLLRLPDALRDR